MIFLTYKSCQVTSVSEHCHVSPKVTTEVLYPTTLSILLHELPDLTSVPPSCSLGFSHAGLLRLCQCQARSHAGIPCSRSALSPAMEMANSLSTLGLGSNVPSCTMPPLPDSPNLPDLFILCCFFPNYRNFTLVMCLLCVLCIVHLSHENRSSTNIQNFIVLFNDNLNSF